MKKSDIVKTYLSANETLPDRTLARLIYKKHKDLWESEEGCYQSVRYYRGNQGSRNRAGRKNKQQFKRVPPPAKKPQKPTKLKEKGSWLIISDMHVPYHDVKTIEESLKYARDSKVDHLLINGDAFDAYMNSRYERHLSARSVDEELETLAEIIKLYEEIIPGRKVYKIGNHEDRVGAYLHANAPHAINMSDFSLTDSISKALDLKGWTMIDSKEFFKLGSYWGYHGHEFSGYGISSAYPARTLLQKAGHSCFAAHCHHHSKIVEYDASKETKRVAITLPCMCEIHPGYAMVNKWHHGFAVAHCDKETYIDVYLTDERKRAEAGRTTGRVRSA